MPKIKLKIANRPYEISCNAGDEGRIMDLAANLDKRVSAIAKNLGQASESMVLVITALMMEDEIHNLSLNNPAPNDNNAQDIPQATEVEVNARINRAVAEALMPFTSKLEALANSLEVE